MDALYHQLRAGTTVYHGTSARFESDQLRFPSWVSDCPTVAAFFARRDCAAAPRIIELVVQEDAKLLLIESSTVLEELTDQVGIRAEDLGDPNELIAFLAHYSAQGWIIPKNYPTGDDIVLLHPICSTIREFSPACLAQAA